MKITHEFTVSVPPAEAWAVLTDLEAIAPCMPGASLTGCDGETYQGKVRVKLGPVISDFGGTAKFTEKDDATHHAVIDAKGKDTRGSGNASARITADLKPDGTGTLVSVDTDLSISGKVAQFGSSMIKQVSEKLLGEFTTCLETKLAAGTLRAAPTAEVPPTVQQPEPSDVRPAATATDQLSARAEGGPAEGDPAPLDLMHLAGGSVAKRVVPALVVLIVIAVVIYLIVR
jgi:carbon monoxide dehydrogenase subunit G